MLIRSQDKVKIIQLNDFVIAVDVDDEYTNDGAYAINACKPGTSWEIGHYTTKEKAIKVLDMIQAAYEKYEYEKVFKTGLTLFEAFQMPNDSEVNV